jgi:hypothetical protein
MSATLASPLRADAASRGRSPRPYTRGRRRLRPTHRFLAAEPSGPYRATEPAVDGPNGPDRATEPALNGPNGPDCTTEPAATEQETDARYVDSSDLLDRLATTVDAVGAVDLVAMSDPELDVHLQRLRRPIAALEAARARTLAEVERRASRAAGPHRQNAEVQETRRRAAKGQRMTPSEAKRTAEAGRHAGRHEETGRAFDGGDIGPTHVRLIGEALERLPEEQRADAELELLELARSRDAVAFGRVVRELLARRVPAALHRDEGRRHRERRFRMTDTADGGVAFSGLAFGMAAELARTALGAFRRPDSPDEHRTPDQRGADAFEQLCEAALRLGEAPTLHGERPQVIVVVEAEQLGEELGVARFAGSGQPVTLAELGSLLTDCTISRLVRDAAGTPLEVSRHVRTVPAGLWRALVVRDGGCRWAGCDAPASWCDVAHGQRAYRNKGRLSPANAVLLCRRHHRRFDRGPWRLEIDGDDVRFHREVVPFVHPLDRQAASRPARARAGPEPPEDDAEGTVVTPDRDDGVPEELRMLGPPEQLSLSDD